MSRSERPPPDRASAGNHRQEAHFVALLDTGEDTTADLADLFGVARSTVYRAVERERILKAATPSIPTPGAET